MFFDRKDFTGFIPLIAKNNDGYKNIIELSSKSYLENDGITEPHCDFFELNKENKGIAIFYHLEGSKKFIQIFYIYHRLWVRYIQSIDCCFVKSCHIMQKQICGPSYRC